MASSESGDGLNDRLARLEEIRRERDGLPQVVIDMPRLVRRSFAIVVGVIGFAFLCLMAGGIILSWLDGGGYTDAGEFRQR